MCIVCRIDDIDKYHNQLCFKCRRVWKTRFCPVCKTRNHNHGSFFKAPKQKDKKAWRNLEMLALKDELYKRYDYDSL